jgi:hypothetical protein
MKKLMTLCVMGIFFVGMIAGAQEKAKIDRGVKSIPNPLHNVETVVQTSGNNTVMIKPGTITLNPIVTTGIENIRTLLGGGRHIVLDESGNIHVAGLQGNGATYSLWYSVSDDASTFNNFTAIGTNGAGGRDRYPAIAVNGTKVSIAFHNQISGEGLVAKNPDPLGGGSFSITNSLTTTPSCWLSMIYADKTTNNLYATWVETNGVYPTLVVNMAKSTDGGDNWFKLGMLPDSLYNVASTYGPSNNPIMAQGNYVIAQLWSDDSLKLVNNFGFDSAIYNHQAADFRGWAMYTESTDGGLTWTPAQLQFGPSRTDFPNAKVIVDGVVRQVRACGGAYWPSVSSGFIKDGIVYMVTPGSLIDFDNADFASGNEVAILSMKPVGIGGTWTHRVISGDMVVYGVNQRYGYQRFGELSMMSGAPLHLAFVYNDVARPDEQIAITVSNDGGYTWITDTTSMQTHGCFIDQVTDLGFSAAAALYMHTAEKFTTSGIDVSLLTGADGAITNTTQYHIRIPKPTSISVDENGLTVNEFKLAQNYPNPFNPTTTIAYDVKGNSKVTLKIYNLLGQEVRTLVNARQTAGNYKVDWNGKDNAGKAVASGVYLYRLEAGDVKLAKKMMFMK